MTEKAKINVAASAIQNLKDFIELNRVVTKLKVAENISTTREQIKNTAAIVKSLVEEL